MLIQNTSNLMLPIESYELEKMCSMFDKGRKRCQTLSDPNKNYIQHVTEPYCRVSSSYIKKKLGILHFCQKNDHGCLFICNFYYFFQRWSFQATDPRSQNPRGFLIRIISSFKSTKQNFSVKSKVLTRGWPSHIPNNFCSIYVLYLLPTKKLPLKTSLYFQITNTMCTQWANFISSSPSPVDCFGLSHPRRHS